MADAIDQLERDLERAICNLDGDDVLGRVYAAIDNWRTIWGSDSIYVARVSHTRRNAKVVEMDRQGVSHTEIAKEVGLSTKQIRRITSSYLGV